MYIKLSKATLRSSVFVALVMIAVFVRLQNAVHPFSYDYNAYLNIIDGLRDLLFSDIVGRNLFFPYVVVEGIVPLEVGFAIIVRLLATFGWETDTLYSMLAALSVGLRVFAMEALRVPRHWTVLINLLAITLLEANAIRLGVSVSILIAGFYSLLKGHRIVGYLAVAVAGSIHLQAALFILPFLSFYIFSAWITRTKLRTSIVLSLFSLGSVGVVQVIPLLANEKINEYVARGGSGSAGLSVTSVLAICFLYVSAMIIRRNGSKSEFATMWAAIIAASVPAIILLTLLTNVAVVGDRAWQLSFFVLSIFYFSEYIRPFRSRAASLLMCALAATLFANIMLRYPLSNFLTPPFPSIDERAY